MHPGEFVPNVALISTGLALLAILLSWLLYGRSPLQGGQTGSAARACSGRSSPAWSASGIVDEVYRPLILDRYVDLCPLPGRRDRRPILARLVPREGHLAGTTTS